MKPVERNKRRTYTRLCLRIQDLERIYQLVAETDPQFDFEYGDDAIESMEDFDKLREMRKSAPCLRVFSGQIRLWISPWGAELEAQSRTLEERPAKLFLEIDDILRNRQVFLTYFKIQCSWAILIILSAGIFLGNWLDPQGYTQRQLGYVSFLIVLTWAIINFVLRRRVKIKWDRKLRFAPDPEKVTSSLVAYLIGSVITFFATVYWQPVVKPLIDEIISEMFGR